MSEDENEFNLEDLGLSTDDLTFASPSPAAEPAEGEPGTPPMPAGEPAEAADATEVPEAAESLEGTERPAGAEPAGEEAPPEGAEEAEAKPKKPLPAWMGYLQYVGVVLCGAAIYGLFALLHAQHPICHTVYLFSLVVLGFVTWKVRKVWARFEVTALYTLLLGGTIAILVTGLYLLALSLCTYDWDIGAKVGKTVQITTRAQADRPFDRPAAAPRPAAPKPVAPQPVAPTPAGQPPAAVQPAPAKPADQKAAPAAAATQPAKAP